MKNLLISFKRHFAFLILILIIVFLLWVRLVIAPKVSQETKNVPPLSLSLSPTPIVPESLTVSTKQSPPEKSPSVSNAGLSYNYQGPLFISPKSLPVYALQSPVEIGLERAITYAQIYNFSTQPASSEKNPAGFSSYFWSENKRVFSVSGFLPIIHLSDFTVFDASPSTTGLTTIQLLEKTKEQLTKLGVRNVNFDKATYKYYKTASFDQAPNKTTLLETFDPKEATFVGIGLSYNLDNYTVFTNSSSGSPLFFVFDLQGNLYKFTIYVLNDLKTNTTISVLPFSDVVKNLNSKGVIISAFTKEGVNQEELSVYSLKTVGLKSVELTYYLSTNPNEPLVPYYVFTGEALDKTSGLNVIVRVALPIN